MAGLWLVLALAVLAGATIIGLRYLRNRRTKKAIARVARSVSEALVRRPSNVKLVTMPRGNKSGGSKSGRSRSRQEPHKPLPNGEPPGTELA